MIYLQLFFSFLQVGMFSIGGGYAAMPLIKAQVVEQNAWLTMNEFTDLITIAEMTPGPIAVNSATFAGIRIAGIPGALVATFGCIFPSIIFVSLLAFIYFRYKNLSVLQSILRSLRPAVVALIASAGISIFLQAVFGGNALGVSGLDVMNLVLFIGAFAALQKFKCSPIFVMTLCGALKLVFELIRDYVQ